MRFDHRFEVIPATERIIKPRWTCEGRIYLLPSRTIM